LLQWSTLILVLLWLESGIAAKPSIEGLFRNGDNAELIGETAVLSLEIESLKSNLIPTNIPEGEQESEAGISTDGESEEPLATNVTSGAEEFTAEEEHRFIKLHFRQTANGSVKLMQAEYTGAEMKRSQLVQIKTYHNFGRQLDKEERDQTKLFYSLMMMFALNDSRPISALLKKHNLDFLENREIMNEEKVQLYKRYKEYLTSIKEDKNLKEELISPLTPEEEEEKVLTQEILKMAMYRSSDRIKLVKHDGDFFWQLSLERSSAMFQNQSHRLQMLHTQLGERRHTIYCDEYVLYNGVHALPKEIRVELDDGSAHRVKIIRYSNFEDRKKSFIDRVSGYNEVLLKRSKKLQESGDKPLTLPPYQRLNFIY
jgi:hypothetical protein